jgi:hypothetical protein
MWVDVMNRRRLARELVYLASELMAFEFPSKDALEKYLKEHPDADLSLHKVIEDKKKPSSPEEQEGKKSEGEADHPKIKKMQKDPPVSLSPDQNKTYKERVGQYRVEIVGDNEENAKKVAAELARGIQETSDICKINPPICQGNLGITRSNMPQLHDKSLKAMREDAEKDSSEAKALGEKAEAATDTKDKEELEKKSKKKALDAEDTKKKIKAAIDAGADPDDDKSTTEKFLDKLKSDGVKIKGLSGDYEEIPVGDLRATQREIQAKKTAGMADAYFSGKFRPNKNPIIVSTEKDGSHCILDGHHRWSSALTADPSMKMKCTVVDMPIRDMLKASLDMPGVYRADLKGNIISKDTPLDLSGWKEGEEKKVTEARLVGRRLFRLARLMGV